MTQCEQANNEDARKLPAGLLLYFVQEGNEGSPISALETCTDIVRAVSRENMVHSVPPLLTVKKHMHF
jgi:hypothetical protein